MYLYFICLLKYPCPVSLVALVINPGPQTSQFNERLSGVLNQRCLKLFLASITTFVSLHIHSNNIKNLSVTTNILYILAY